MPAAGDDVVNIEVVAVCINKKALPSASVANGKLPEGAPPPAWYNSPVSGKYGMVAEKAPSASDETLAKSVPSGDKIAIHENGGAIPITVPVAG